MSLSGTFATCRPALKMSARRVFRKSRFRVVRIEADPKPSLVGWTYSYQIAKAKPTQVVGFARERPLRFNALLAQAARPPGCAATGASHAAGAATEPEATEAAAAA